MYSSTKNKWDYKGVEIIVSHWNLPNAAREIRTFSLKNLIYYLSYYRNKIDYYACSLSYTI